MKFPGVATLVGAFAASAASAGATQTTPVSKVLQLLSDLQAKVIQEGEEAQKVYSEYSEWCEDRARQLSHEMKTGVAEVESLKASIAQEESTTATLNAKVEELTSAIAIDTADLKAAEEIRAREAADFSKEESELVETISMLKRATGILEREMAKGGASMLQSQSATNLADALKVLVEAASFSSADAAQLSALLQNSQQAKADQEDGDVEIGAPAAAVYKGHNANIIETLESLGDKAEEQLAELRKKETADTQHFELLKQSLQDELRVANEDLSESKKGLAASAESRSSAEGDLGTTQKDLQADTEAKADLHHACMTKAEDFEAETKSRGEELRALAEAKKVIAEATGNAETATYGLAQVPSLLQVERFGLASGADLANFEVVRLVRALARKQQSTELAQLAQRLSTALRLSAGGSTSDPFAKVKGLISDMISKLESEAGADATKKAYCDKEISETTEKKGDKTAEIEKLGIKIDQASAASAQLKEEVSELHAALAQLASAQADMDRMRQQEHEIFVKNKADLEQGLEGIKMALKILKEYYAAGDKAHSAAVGAGEGIIGLIEVIESDFSKNMAGIMTAEEAATASYEDETRENSIEKTMKSKSVEYKTKESVNLDKSIAELSSDRAGVQAELDAILEYLKRIEEQCVERAESYESRKSRREAEIAGLKEALEVLESETALLQRHRGVARRQARGALRGAAVLAAS